MLRRDRTKDQLVALFVLGVLLLLPPLVVIFNQPLRFLGIPVLYLYLFLAWFMLICMTAAVVRQIDASESTDASPPRPRAPERQDDA